MLKAQAQVHAHHVKARQSQEQKARHQRIADAYYHADGGTIRHTGAGLFAYPDPDPYPYPYPDSDSDSDA